MSFYDKLSAKLSAVKTEADLFGFYQMLWENGILLNGA